MHRDAYTLHERVGPLKNTVCVASLGRREIWLVCLTVSNCSSNTNPQLNDLLDAPIKCARMEQSMSFNSYDTEEEERLYCSAPLNEEDIVWAGSDTEQSAEEMERKRLRYECHAKRYLQGYMPVLQSASLKGSFQKDWINPWRYRQRKVPSWWQPGSKDMLFTRANVMKRAADNGMGHLNPREALAWCKAEAVVEAQRNIETQVSSEGGTISGDDFDAESLVDGQTVLSRVHNIQYPGKCQSIAESNPTHSCFLETRDSMVEPQHEDSGPENIDDGRGYYNPKSTKILAASQWLKGSYVSRRALWDGPANSSPTPVPHLRNNKERVRRQTPTRRPACHELDTSAPNFQTPRTPETQADAGTFYSGPRTAHGILRENIATKPFQLGHNQALSYSGLNRHNEGSEKGVSDDIPEEAIFISAMNNVDGVGLQSGSCQPSPSTFECKNALTSALLPSSISNKRKFESTASHQIKLSALSPRSKVYVNCNAERIGDISFVTEIAPSSRDLEHFQYRKKRRRSSIRQHLVDAEERSYEHVQLLPRSTSRSSLIGGDTSNSCIEEKLDAIWQGVSCDSDMINVHLGSSTSEAVSPVVDNAPAPETPPSCKETSGTNEDAAQSEQSVASQDALFGSSWDMMNDIRDPIMAITAKFSAGKRELSKYSSLDQNIPEDILPLCDQPSLNLASQGLPITNPSVTPRSQTSLQSTKLTGKPPIQRMTKQMERSDLLEEMATSTQSYNTTPRCSRQSRHNQSSASACRSIRNGPKSQVSNRVSNAEGLKDITGTAAVYSCQEELRPRQIHDDQATTVLPSVTTNHQEILDPMHTAHEALSQNCRSRSNILIQSQTNHSAYLPHEIPPNQGAPEAKIETPVEIINYESLDGTDQAAWHAVDPQSPWATVILDPIIAYNSSKPHGIESSIVLEPEDTSRTRNSHEHDVDEGEDSWQHLEPTETPEQDDIKPFKDFMTLTPSPGSSPTQPTDENLLRTQLLTEATMINPWTSSFKNPASGRSQKRVSFGALLSSEVHEGNGPDVSHSLKHVPGSPPPPLAAKKLRVEDAFKDGTTVVDNFKEHFIAVARVSRECLGEDYPSTYLSSPAVGAMAEAFIAADQETSTKHKRYRMSDENHTRHLKPSSKARTNINSSNISNANSLLINHEKELAAVSCGMVGNNMGDDMDDFIGDAGHFLEEWSVAAELRKGKSTGRLNRRSDQADPMFELTREW